MYKKLPVEVTVGKTRYLVQRKRVLPYHRKGTTYLPMKRDGTGFIEIATEAATRRKYTANDLLHTLWHEIVHAILHDMDSPHWANESLVDGIAKRILQVLKTWTSSQSVGPSHPSSSLKIAPVRTTKRASQSASSPRKRTKSSTASKRTKPPKTT